MTGPRRSSVATRLLQMLAAITALVVLAAACSSSDDSSTTGGTDAVNQGAPTDEGTPQDGGVLKVGVGADIDGLYPVEARWSLDGNLIGSSIYDTLLSFDEERNLVPRLALSVTPNDDGTVWTMKLRPDVTFHDGTPFDAAAVKANIDARKAVPISGDSLKAVQEVVVVDSLTAEVQMNTPWFGYDYTLAAQAGYMVAPSLIGQTGAMQKAVGTGPFELDGTWSNGSPVKVKRYDGYWGDRAHLDGIEFQALIDQSSRMASLESGDVDLIFTQDPTTVKKFRSTDGFIQVEDFAAEETFAMLNLGEPPFDNIHARRALAYATDPEAANQAVGGGIQQVADQPYTDDEQYYVEDVGLRHVRHGQGAGRDRGVQGRHRRIVAVVPAEGALGWFAEDRGRTAPGAMERGRHRGEHQRDRAVGVPRRHLHEQLPGEHVPQLRLRESGLELHLLALELRQAAGPGRRHQLRPDPK